MFTYTEIIVEIWATLNNSLNSDQWKNHVISEMRCSYCLKIDSWDSPWDGLLRKWNGSVKKSFMFKHESRSLHAKLTKNPIYPEILGFYIVGSNN